ncbi:MAG: VCBS repeat-containing protein, partial [Actinobacteria bacterium]|nr:VCBS repeat-containing protein [Actinomycetota bacterium]NIV59164.1 hypothetical protein [Actinomycetota bacterium]NIV90770.1 hypothetical protein [Actinomycetota bacterium]
MLGADAAADLDNDGRVDLVERTGTRLRLRVGDADWTVLESLSGPSGEHSSMTVVDKDHDGDLDLFWCTENGCAIAVNDGAGSLTPDASAEGLVAGPLAPPIQVAFSDLDNDRDVDLVVADANAVRWLSNQRDGTFRSIGAERGLGTAAGGGPLQIVDLDKNGTMDLLLGGS